MKTKSGANPKNKTQPGTPLLPVQNSVNFSVQQPMTTTTPTVGATETPTLTVPTATTVPPTATLVPPTATLAPPTATVVAPTATTAPPTATLAPPTATPQPGQPALPPLEWIAYNRLAFGPQPGDLDAFRALPGATIRDKFLVWLDQQLNPRSINDNACTTIVANHGLPTMVYADNAESLRGALAQPPQGGGATGPVKIRLPIVGKGEAITPDSVLRNHWHTYYRARYRSTNASTYGGQYPEDRPADDVVISSVLRARYSNRQLYEVMVEFWHNHFSIYAFEGYARWTWQHFDTFVIRRNALGNFKTFLEDVAKSPAMLYYLDNYINTRGGPNENWARELFELHGLGAENYGGTTAQSAVPGYPAAPVHYVDEDVYESTRCFTGWTVNDAWGQDANPASWGTGAFQYVQEDHDRFQKIVLGNTMAPDGAPMADGMKVIELIANHPGTARYIARRMCIRLIGDNVDEATVQAVADVFYANRTADDQIAKTVRAIATSAAFANTYADKIKRPYEAMISALRTAQVQLNMKPTLKTGTDAQGKPNAWWEDNMFRWDGLNNNYEALGMPMFQRRSPDGWPDKQRNWSGSTGMIFRWKLMFFILDTGSKTDRTDIDVDVVGQTNTHVPVRSTANIVDYWIDRLVGQPMAAATRNDLIQYLGKGSATPNLNDAAVARRLVLMVSLILSSPEFNWR